MSQIYADEVIPPRAADSRGQNKTNAEDAGSDSRRGFLEDRAGVFAE